MTRFLHANVPVTLALSAMVLALGGAIMAACAPGLPDPESEGAKLYVQYCSGEACHGPIPPQSGGPGYWRNQYERMLPIMEDAGSALPDPDQDRKIRAYLQKYAS